MAPGERQGQHVSSARRRRRPPLPQEPSLLIAHEDKTYPGAIIASLSIPWGERRATRSSAATTSSGRATWSTARRRSSLSATSDPAPRPDLSRVHQRRDGGFPQNFWINGEPYWNGDPARRGLLPDRPRPPAPRGGRAPGLRPLSARPQRGGLPDRPGPGTPQERWEETSGFSPSTLASNIAALVCAAQFARERDDEKTARFLEEYADFLEPHVDLWTVTTEGTLVPGISRHFIRIHPHRPERSARGGEPERGLIPEEPGPGARTDLPGEGGRRRGLPRARPLRDPASGDR